MHACENPTMTKMLSEWPTKSTQSNNPQTGNPNAGQWNSTATVAASTSKPRLLDRTPQAPTQSHAPVPSSPQSILALEDPINVGKPYDAGLPAKSATPSIPKSASATTGTIAIQTE